MGVGGRAPKIGPSVTFTHRKKLNKDFWNLKNLQTNSIAKSVRGLSCYFFNFNIFSYAKSQTTKRANSDNISPADIDLVL